MRRFICEFTDIVPSKFMALFSVHLMISIKLFKLVAKVGTPSLFSGATAVQSRPKSHAFTVNNRGKEQMASYTKPALTNRNN